MNIVLTGCAGFIGHRIASLLLDRGHKVHGIDILGDSRFAELLERRLDSLLCRPGFSFHTADATDSREIRELFEGFSESGPLSAVVNLAALAGVRTSAENPRAYYEVNVLGTLNLLELCREFGVGKFILASTSSVYGAEVDGPVSETADSSRPLSPYAASKKAAETLLYSYHHLFGIDVVALRYFTACGTPGHERLQVHPGHRGGRTHHGVRRRDPAKGTSPT